MDYTETFLYFWFENNELIIQWATLILIINITFLAVMSYLRRNISSNAPHLDAKLQSLDQRLRRMEGMDSGISNNLQRQRDLAKIKDLEKKLTEYQVIEDDIANLSKYKEENKELRERLAQTRSNHKK